MTTIKPKSQTDRDIILDWLARINETDKVQIAFVIEQCSKDKEAREYYLNYAKGLIK